MASNASVTKFQRLLNALPNAAREPLRLEIWQQAEGLRLAMSFAVPQGGTGRLRQSIRTEQGRNPLRVLVRAGGPLTTGGKSPLAKLAGFGNYDYALAQEFGTQKHPAQPFFWPSYRARKKDMRKAIKASAKAAINRLVPLS